MEHKPLTTKEHAFVVARLQGLGVAASYRAAYSVANMSAETVNARASEVEHRPRVRAALDAKKAEALSAANVDMPWVVSQWLQLAIADPGELMTVVRDACRHCWGFDHRFHWRDENEWAAECAQALERGKPAPDLAGGYGFRRLRGPHPECPQCEGEGVTREVLADLKSVSPGARRLFAGVERTKSGLKIHTRSQDQALTNLAKALGGFVENVRHSGTVGVAPVDVDLTDAQREAAKRLALGLL